MGPGSEKSVLHQGDEGQNEARKQEKCPSSRGLRTKRGPEARKVSFIKGMKDKSRPGSKKSVLHRGDEGQNEFYLSFSENSGFYGAHTLTFGDLGSHVITGKSQSP